MRFLLLLIIFAPLAISAQRHSGPGSQSTASSDSAKAHLIIENYLQAIGTKAAFDSLRSIKIVQKGKSQSVELTLSISAQRPNKFSVETSVQGMKMSQMVSDGTNFSLLVRNQKIPTDATAQALAAFEWAIVPELQLNELGVKVVYKGSEMENNAKLNIIEYTINKSIKILNYFDAGTGLKVKTLRQQTSAMGNVDLISRFSDYQDVNGIKFPSKIKQWMGTIETSYTVESIEVNPVLDDALFKVP